MSNPKTFIVAVYLVDKACGGPEEGGWWYERGEIVRVMRTFRNERMATTYCQRLDDKLQASLNKGRRPIDSVLSEGVFQPRVFDDFAPQYFPATRPQYE